jgi:hypothetical protein
MSDPLAFANPRSLDELFNRDPLDLADQDIDVIVAEYRRQRAVWLSDQEMKFNSDGTPKATRTKAGPKPEKPKFTLESLGLKK